MAIDSKKVGFTFIWSLENLQHAFQRKGEYIESPIFKVRSICKARNIDCSLRIYPRGQAEGRDSNYMSYALHIEKIDRNRKQVILDYHLSFLCGNGRILLSTKGTDIFQLDRDRCVDERTNRGDAHDKFNKLLKDDLTIRCRILKLDGKNTDIRTCFARSRIEVQKTSFVWTIPKFNDLQPNEKVSIFVESVSMKMELYFTGEDRGEVSLHVEILYLDENKRKHTSCEISLLDGDGKTVQYKKDERCFSDSPTEVWKFPSFSSGGMGFIRRLCSPSDALHLRCKCSVSSGEFVSFIENYGGGSTQTVKTDSPSSYDEESLPITLRGALKKLYDDQVYSDGSLQVGDKIFPAHKAIFSARSPVFSAMFERDMMEKKTGVVEIPDLQENTVHHLLRFIYTETVEDLGWEDIIKLYIASDKYDVSQLRNKCRSLLILGMSQSNIIEVLLLSDMHSDDALKRIAHDFIRCNKHEIFSTDEWMEFMKSNNQLTAETMQIVFKKTRIA